MAVLGSGTAVPVIVWIILAATDRHDGYSSWHFSMLLAAVFVPVAAGGWFLSRCWAHTETTGRRCRQPRWGLLARCEAPSHRASIYDLWGVLEGCVAAISLLVVLNDIVR